MMAVARKGTLNARQRARLAVQGDQEKLKRQVDLFTEALTAVDARDQAEVRLGHAFNELRGMGLSRADIAERTGLAPREVSAAMRAAKEAEALQANDENETEEGDELTTSAGGVDVSEGSEFSGDSGADQDVNDDAKHDVMTVHSSDPVPVH
ncbi:hypothetical protein NYP18_13185 [Corynebacterium sp. YIM 101645]|uniref:DNA-binding protein n=1 Tax=Corynebacterium lemuris TaxID=1859292 RepID=A0ABT2G0T0_9CORY|nr:hypothetical protein [Corynebacterium lemuris]MCS5480605.1 hypothetical protein [Corynebacterium lemuris]